MVGKKENTWNSGRCTCGTAVVVVVVVVASSASNIGGLVEEILRGVAVVVRNGPTGAREVMEATVAF
jgi:hypothetical protein